MEIKRIVSTTELVPDAHRKERDDQKYATNPRNKNCYVAPGRADFRLA